MGTDRRRAKAAATDQHYFCCSASKYLRRREAGRRVQRCRKSTKRLFGIEEASRVSLPNLQAQDSDIRSKGNGQTLLSGGHHTPNRRARHYRVQNQSRFVLDVIEGGVPNISLLMDPATLTPTSRIQLAYCKITNQQPLLLLFPPVLTWPVRPGSSVTPPVLLFPFPTFSLRRLFAWMFPCQESPGSDVHSLALSPSPTPFLS